MIYLASVILVTLGLDARWLAVRLGGVMPVALWMAQRAVFFLLYAPSARIREAGPSQNGKGDEVGWVGTVVQVTIRSEKRSWYDLRRGQRPFWNLSECKCGRLGKEH
jgi:hypothetical protein